MEDKYLYMRGTKAKARFPVSKLAVSSRGKNINMEEKEKILIEEDDFLTRGTM
jgi:hypothetical protein